MGERRALGGRGERGEGRIRFALRSSLLGLRGLAHLGVRVRFAGEAVEPAVEVMAESAGAQDAEAVFLPEVVNLDDGVRHG